MNIQKKLNKNIFAPSIQIFEEEIVLNNENLRPIPKLNRIIGDIRYLSSKTFKFIKHEKNEKEDIKPYLSDIYFINIYFHGNADSIFGCWNHLANIEKHLLLKIENNKNLIDKNIRIYNFTFEYPGYETRSIEDLNQEKLLAWSSDLKKYIEHFIFKITQKRHEKLCLIHTSFIGFSLGCGFLLNLAVNLDIKIDTIILQAPFDSILQMIKKNISAFYFNFLYYFLWENEKYEYFDNIKNLNKLGNNDTIKITIFASKKDEMMGYTFNTFSNLEKKYANISVIEKKCFHLDFLNFDEEISKILFINFLNEYEKNS